MKSLDYFTDNQVMNQSKSNFYDSDDDDGGGGSGDIEEDGHQMPRYDSLRNRGSGSSNSNSFGIWNSSSLGHVGSAEVAEQKTGASSQAKLIARIGQTIKDRVGDLLHAIEGVSSHITQLEGKTRHLEHTTDDLKGTVESMYAGREEKMRHLENILQEVHVGIQFLKDKREIADAQLLLKKLQLSRTKVSKPPLEIRNADVLKTSVLQSSSIASAPPHIISSLPFSASSSLFQAHHPHPPLHLSPLPPHAQIFATHPQSNLPNMNISHPFNVSPPHQNLSPQPPLPPLLSSQRMVEIAYGAQSLSSFPRPQGNILNLQFPNTAIQQYHFPILSPEMQQPPATAPQEPFSFTAQPHNASQLDEAPVLHPSLVGSIPRYGSSPSHHLVEMPYMPSNGYSSGIPQSPRASGTGLSTENLRHGPHGSSQSLNRSSSADFSEWRSFSGLSNGSHDLNHYHQNESGSSHLSLKMKDSQQKSPVLNPSNQNDQLKKPLQYALPIASALDHEPGSGLTQNKASVDDVIEKVATMGFRRDLARDVVRKLKESSQPVDLNAVLDKLMSQEASRGS